MPRYAAHTLMPHQTPPSTKQQQRQTQRTQSCAEQSHTLLLGTTTARYAAQTLMRQARRCCHCCCRFICCWLLSPLQRGCGYSWCFHSHLPCCRLQCWRRCCAASLGQHTLPPLLLPLCSHCEQLHLQTHSPYHSALLQPVRVLPAQQLLLQWVLHCLHLRLSWAAGTLSEASRWCVHARPLYRCPPCAAGAGTAACCRCCWHSL
jgi:hypothetical protein